MKKTLLSIVIGLMGYSFAFGENTAGDWASAFDSTSSSQNQTAQPKKDTANANASSQNTMISQLGAQMASCNSDYQNYSSEKPKVEYVFLTKKDYRIKKTIPVPKDKVVLVPKIVESGQHKRKKELAFDTLNIPIPVQLTYDDFGSKEPITDGNTVAYRTDRSKKTVMVMNSSGIKSFDGIDPHNLFLSGNILLYDFLNKNKERQIMRVDINNSDYQTLSLSESSQNSTKGVTNPVLNQTIIAYQLNNDIWISVPNSGCLNLTANMQNEKKPKVYGEAVYFVSDMEGSDNVYKLMEADNTGAKKVINETNDKWKIIEFEVDSGNIAVTVDENGSFQTYLVSQKDSTKQRINFADSEIFDISLNNNLFAYVSNPKGGFGKNYVYLLNIQDGKQLCVGEGKSPSLSENKLCFTKEVDGIDQIFSFDVPSSFEGYEKADSLKQEIKKAHDRLNKSCFLFGKKRKDLVEKLESAYGESLSRRGM